MKKVIVLSFIFMVTQIFAVTVDGYAFLEGETDHSGIEVSFQKVAPDTLFTNTVYSDTTGYYSAVVEEGWYDVKYNKSGFTSADTTNVSIYSNTTLLIKTLLTQGLSGPISGVLTSGEYRVDSTISIEEGDTLIIEAGTFIKFDSNTGLDVHGLLLAEGTEYDSIVFSAYSTSWEGINFYNTADNNSFINYCILEKSNYRAININQSNLTIKNSVFRHNIVPDYSYFGGSIYAYNCENVQIENCNFKMNNYATIYFEEGKAEMRNCSISDNDGCLRADNTEIQLDSCDIINNEYYQILYGNNSSFVIINCRINNNITNIGNNQGCAIKQNNGVKLIINNSEICYNTGTLSRGLLIIDSADNIIANSTISYNLDEGIYTNNSPIQLYNSNIIGNHSYGLYSINNTNEHLIKFNNINDNNGGSNFYDFSEYVGVNVTTNANADSCDAYGNISMDPKFVDASSGNFRLQSDSPCIDAGTNTITGYDFPIADLDDNYRIWDGDGNGSEIVDIGAFEFGSHSTSIDNGQFTINSYSLHQNYPNPFNPETTIRYSLINNAQVNLKVYDIAGREVCYLVNQKKNKGSHEVKFDGSMLTSGIYFYRLSLDGKAVENRKMMLLK